MFPDRLFPDGYEGFLRIPHRTGVGTVAGAAVFGFPAFAGFYVGAWFAAMLNLVAAISLFAITIGDVNAGARI